jgi:TPR repeat protein
MIEPAPSQNERGRDRENGSKRRPRFRAWRVGAILLFGGLCCAEFARADAISAGMGAYAHRDYVRSAAIFMRRAEQGQAIAQTYLGYMYEKGRGVPQDFVLAATWLRRAANQGYPDAQFLLGLLYDKGHGVNQDFLEAEIWLNLAAAKAEPRQRDYWTQIRDALAGKLTLDERAEAQRRASEWAPIQER